MVECQRWHESLSWPASLRLGHHIADESKKRYQMMSGVDRDSKIELTSISSMASSLSSESMTPVIWKILPAKQFGCPTGSSYSSWFQSDTSRRRRRR